MKHFLSQFDWNQISSGKAAERHMEKNKKWDYLFDEFKRSNEEGHLLSCIQ